MAETAVTVSHKGCDIAWSDLTASMMLDRLTVVNAADCVHQLVDLLRPHVNLVYTISPDSFVQSGDTKIRSLSTTSNTEVMQNAFKFMDQWVKRSSAIHEASHTIPSCLIVCDLDRHDTAFRQAIRSNSVRKIVCMGRHVHVTFILTCFRAPVMFRSNASVIVTGPSAVAKSLDAPLEITRIVMPRPMKHDERLP